MEAIAVDLVEQGAVNCGHHQTGALSAAILLGQQGERFVIATLGSFHLEPHEAHEVVAMASIDDVGGGYIELLQFIDRQVDTSFAAVLADVTDNIGQLKSQAELFCKLQGGLLGHSENAGRKNADYTGHMPAITLQTDEVEIAGLVQIHLHAIDDGLQVFAFEAVRCHMRLQRQGHWMTRVALQHGGNFLAPPHQFGAGDIGILDFIDGIVHLAAEGVERSDGTPSFHRQKQKAVIKTRAALGGFLLAIFVRRHEVKMAGKKRRVRKASTAGAMREAAMLAE